MEGITINGVYYVDSPDMNPVAIRPEIRLPSVAWEDTSHGRVLQCTKLIIDGSEINSSTSIDPNRIPNHIDIISQGKTYKLEKLTNEIFNEKLKDRVAGGKNMNFNSDAALQEYYLKADFYGVGL